MSPRGRVDARVDAKDVVINPKLQALLDRQTDDELRELHKSLETYDCLDPLIVALVDGVWTLLDGHARKPYCDEHHIPYEVTAIELPAPTIEQAELWVELNQLGRRNLDSDIRAVLAVSIMNRRAASVRSPSERGKLGGRGHKAVGGNAHSFRLRTQVARQTKVSQHKLKTAMAVEKADPQLFAQVRDGLMALGRADFIIKSRKLKQWWNERANDPDGKFDVLVIDPPWKAESGGSAGFITYETLELPQIDKLVGAYIEKFAADDCRLFLWVPPGREQSPTQQSFLFEAAKLVEGWGFEILFVRTWRKDGGPQPTGYPRYNCEYVIVASKGKPDRLPETTDFDLCFDAPRRGHSVKPEEDYHTLGRVTGGKRLDIFNRRYIKGFWGIGDESPYGRGAKWRQWEERLARGEIGVEKLPKEMLADGGLELVKIKDDLWTCKQAPPRKLASRLSSVERRSAKQMNSQKHRAKRSA